MSASEERSQKGQIATCGHENSARCPAARRLLTSDYSFRRPQKTTGRQDTQTLGFPFSLSLKEL